jgi:hypothetical protein
MQCVLCFGYENLTLIKCESCDTIYCSSCFCLYSKKNVSCYKCSYVWGNSFLKKNLGTHWKDIQSSQETILINNEYSLLPHTQNAVHYINQMDKINSEIKHLQETLQRVTDTISELKNEKRSLEFDYIKHSQYKEKYIGLCNIRNCKGYIKMDHICGLCFHPHTPESHPDALESNPDALESHPDALESHPDALESHPDAVNGNLIDLPLFDDTYYDVFTEIKSVYVKKAIQLYKSMCKDLNTINQDIRVQYITNRITQDQFKTLLQKRFKRMEHDFEYLNVLKDYLTLATQLDIPYEKEYDKRILYNTAINKLNEQYRTKYVTLS